MKAPKLCPAEPWNVSWIVSSGRPFGPCRLVTSLPTIVPTTRLRLRMGSVACTFSPRSIAGRHSSRSVVLSSDSSSPCSWAIWQYRPTSGPTSGRCRIGDRSSPRAFQ